MPRVRVTRDFQLGKAWFMIMDGVVHGHQFNAWASTHVSGGGGGGYVSQYGGSVSTSPVTSSVTQHQRTSFWIKDGTDDTNLKLDYDFPITDGQGARLIWGASERADSGDYLYLKNNTTGTYHAYKNAAQMFEWALSNRLVPPSSALKVFGVLAAAVVVLYMIGNAVKWAHGTVGWEVFLCFLAVVVPWLWSSSYKSSKGQEISNYLFPLLNERTK